jgi:hypothetical protein
MIDQSDILLSCTQFQFITLVSGGAQLCCAFYQSRQAARIWCTKTNFLSSTSRFWLFHNKFYSVESHTEHWWIADALSSSCSVSVMQQNHINRTHHPQIVASYRDPHKQDFLSLWSPISIPNQLPMALGKGDHVWYAYYSLISSQTEQFMACLTDFKMVPRGEPAPTSTTSRMDDKWLRNNFLLGSSSLATNHGG